MWIKLTFKMLSPAIIKPYIPLDGVFSYSYAKQTGFKYRFEEGFIYGNLLKRKYKYIEELPIKKTIYGDGKWFYNISGIIFDEVEGIKEIKKYKTCIARKTIIDTQLFSLRGISFESRIVASGKEKSYLTEVETIYYPYFSVVLETDTPDSIENLAEKIVGIGKKVNQGYGKVDYQFMEEVKVENFKYNDLLIRPVPTSLIKDENYLEVEMRLFSPYYIANKKYSDICYVDRKLFKGIPVKFEETSKEPEVIF